MQMFLQVDGGRRIVGAGLLAALSMLLVSPAAMAGPAPDRISLATSEPVEIVAGSEVQFLDASIDAAAWSWDFSYDGSLAEQESTQQNPVWTYLHAGDYPVRLEVCNEAGCGAVVKTVTVVEPCTLEVDLLLPELGLEDLLDDKDYAACRTITTSGAMTVGSGAVVTFVAGRSVALGHGFSVEGGGSFTAGVDPALDKPLP